jgi:hypothetical protein
MYCSVEILSKQLHCAAPSSSVQRDPLLARDMEAGPDRSQLAKQVSVNPGGSAPLVTASTERPFLVGRSDVAASSERAAGRAHHRFPGLEVGSGRSPTTRCLCAAA